MQSKNQTRMIGDKMAKTKKKTKKRKKRKKKKAKPKPQKYQCPVCLKVRSEGALQECDFCGKRGCTVCWPDKKCPSCGSDKLRVIVKAS